ncbi:hypothetical protein ACRRTK_003601 [Alexandromys fortis]
MLQPGGKGVRERVGQSASDFRKGAPCSHAGLREWGEKRRKELGWIYEAILKNSAQPVLCSWKEN